MDSIILIAFVFLAFALLLILFLKTGFSHLESDERRAGRMGERFATQIISEVLKKDDVLLTNVKLSFGGKQTELDNVIINNRGVFIIEVKNYSGELIGGEDDYEWIKNKVTEGGFYQKTVKNPIGQVKRQIYILSNYLRKHGVKVWVEGYVFFVEMNSPVKSDYVLTTQRDIDRALHAGTDNKLSNGIRDKIVKTIS